MNEWGRLFSVMRCMCMVAAERGSQLTKKKKHTKQKYAYIVRFGHFPLWLAMNWHDIHTAGECNEHLTASEMLGGGVAIWHICECVCALLTALCVNVWRVRVRRVDVSEGWHAGIVVVTKLWVGGHFAHALIRHAIVCVPSKYISSTAHWPGWATSMRFHAHAFATGDGRSTCVGVAYVRVINMCCLPGLHRNEGPFGVGWHGTGMGIHTENISKANCIDFIRSTAALETRK